MVKKDDGLSGGEIAAIIIGILAVVAVVAFYINSLGEEEAPQAPPAPQQIIIQQPAGTPGQTIIVQQPSTQPTTTTTTAGDTTGDTTGGTTGGTTDGAGGTTGGTTAFTIETQAGSIACRDSIDNDEDGKVDGNDLDCLGQTCEGGISKKKWIWSYLLTRQSSQWKIASGESQPGLLPQEATIAPALTAPKCLEKRCGTPLGNSGLWLGYASGGYDTTFVGGDEYLCVPGTSLGQQYKNNNLKCSSSANGVIMNFAEAASDGATTARCDGSVWQRD